MDQMTRLREMIDSKIVYDAVYIHAKGMSNAPLCCMDDLLPKLLDLSLLSYCFVQADYSLSAGTEFVASLELYFTPSENHSTNIDGDFINLVSRLRFSEI